jgi:purine-binding chemotaxis protein CheW
MNQPATVTRLPAVTESAEEQQYLVFSLRGETFAVGILNVREIIEYDQLTEVPLMPDAVRGVINLRGAVVPVIDLSACFWKSRTEPGKRTCIVIVELDDSAKQRVMGIVVDAVNKLVEIPKGDIEPPPTFGTQIRTDFIAGMGKLDERFVVILNAERVLSVDQLTAVTDALPMLTAEKASA